VATKARRDTIRTWTIAWVVFWCLIFTATHIPLSHISMARIGNGDKIIHFGMYFVLTLLGGRRLRLISGRVGVRVLLTWAVIYALYGIADERLQPLVSRTCSLADWLADAAGIVAGTVVLLVCRPASTLSEPGAGDA